MSDAKFVGIGIRLKVRTFDGWVIGMIWDDDKGEQIAELGRMQKKIFDGHRERFDAWVDMLSAALQEQVKEVVGIEPHMFRDTMPETEGQA